MKSGGEKLRERLDRRWSSLKQERDRFEKHWMDLADHILPRRVRFNYSPSDQDVKRHANNKLLDSTSIFALRVLTSGLMSGVTSPSRPWFEISLSLKREDESAEVSRWLEALSELLRQVFAASNAYQGLHAIYRDLGTFGTAACWMERDDQTVIRLRPMVMGEYALGVGANGKVDTCYRNLWMTVGQVVEEFGIEAVSDQVRSQYERNEVDRWVEVMHAVEPRRVRDPAANDNQNMPFASFWYEAGVPGEKMLRKSGYRTFPVLAPRWEVEGNEAYGSSPGMEALPDIKQLQTQVREYHKAVQKMVTPPMVGPASLQNRHSTLLPGGITYLDDVDMAKGGFRPAHDVNIRLAELAQSIQQTQSMIERAFYVDLFRMISEMDRRQVTATEIAERRAEKMLGLSPVLERLQSELLDPLIDFTIDALIEMDIPFMREAPEEVQGSDLSVELTSMLARDQRVDAIVGIERLTGYVGGLMQMDPEAGDVFDSIAAASEYAELIGAPRSTIRSEQEREQRRSGRAQEQQAAQGMAMASQGASALRDAAAGAQSLDALRVIQGGAA